MYQHRDIKGSTLDLPVNKVVCVGRNYVGHIKEMNNPVIQEPLLFLKPNTALCPLNKPLDIPKKWGRVDHELEIAVLIGSTLSNASPGQVKNAVVGFAVALDLTLRDMQQECKEKGWPWAKAKGFDNSCPISHFIPAAQCPDWDKIRFSLSVNGELRQKGKSAQMMTPIAQLISYASRFFTLQKGDIVLTGTPQGVASLQEGDRLELTLEDYRVNTVVI
ncbi:fumarylacetoacetate hydrolase family protein [Testudinibacter aquarius]|uniref:2-keto-4-pentenoate hydratase/2-oxohepta-3-ene-1,7-dioic acid hydratase in catechol pathway n=1 Tax=Testudinibacter aquarius TaxID=1524974 RepID=A0A4R3Y107_9PAST|nr:fumarylacetoacetate hydrolase family protein [Testudinibacter aquarius]KAE9528418.1 isomerase/hydrolase [Testudinibacter aquarius]TCV85785.1 2-keto-4-pentenoate hydratase/2-oxohepta-3-ene-1,7-dioic acid hydratase in catechol pathway [Testudinibacter aquarius]TNG93243.1 fumarylacetoacetate hydrolase family protein [Testudinibacter aquarius]